MNKVETKLKEYTEQESLLRAQLYSAIDEELKFYMSKRLRYGALNTNLDKRYQLKILDK